MKTIKHLLVVLAVASLAMPVGAAYADDVDPSAIALQNVTVNQTEVTKQSTQRGLPGYETDADTSRTIGSWTIRYANGVGFGTGGGNKYFRHEFAKTEKLAGSGSYQSEAHASLIRGSSYGGENVFNMFTHPCAQSIVNNGTAQTCTSPWQLSSAGQQWLIISGHYFDIGIDGTQDDTCPGCIDWVYTTP